MCYMCYTSCFTFCTTQLEGLMRLLLSMAEGKITHGHIFAEFEVWGNLSTALRRAAGCLFPLRRRQITFLSKCRDTMNEL
mmetsp:Transcript_33202/g.40157  ORF Transcript_33202/g.40157 Transcript_33202/m.40157 type:complete len:80 (+) Transcript_33202:472-711(+)